MSTHRIFALIIILVTVPVIAQPGTKPVITADQVMATMPARDNARESLSEGYTGYREYVLNNARFYKHVEMQTTVNCDHSETKHLQLLSKKSWKSANKHVLKPMTVSKAESSRLDIRLKSCITKQNYFFHIMPVQSLNGRPVYIIEVLPRQKDKSLFLGCILVDTEDFALARVEEEPGQNLSFWVHSVHLVQQYRKDAPLWFPVLTTSITNACIFGTTSVNIQHLSYKHNKPILKNITASFHSALVEASHAEY